MTPVEAASPESRAAGEASPDRRPPRRGRLLLLGGALVAVALVVVLVLLLGGGGDDDGGPVARRAPAAPATAGELARTAATAGHPVYWLGARDGTTYELTRTRDGRIFIRYLPAGVAVGSDAADYVTVGSYPQAGAYGALARTARAAGATVVSIPGGGRAYQDPDRPTSAYAAFPGSDVQIELFDPTAGAALRAARGGELVAVDAGPARSGEPRAATAAQLAAAARAHGHPLYWAGPRGGATYELTEATDGRVYVRYLEQGVAVGDKGTDHVTVGTYPQADPLAQLREAAAASGAETFAVDGGIAYTDPAHPRSVYVAYRGAGVQVEVYDPRPGQARALIERGEIVPVG
jgi:hypothetical protein